MRLSNAQQMMHTFGACIIHAVLLTMAFLIGFCHYIIQHHSILYYKWIVDLVSIYNEMAILARYMQSGNFIELALKPMHLSHHTILYYLIVDSS